MELVSKDHIPNESSIQASAFYEHKSSITQTPSSEGIYGMSTEHHQNSNSSSASSPSSTNSNGISGYLANYNLPEEGNSVISFKPDYLNFTGSFLSFDQQSNIGEEDNEYPSHRSNSYQGQLNSNHGLPENSHDHHAATGYGSPSGGVQFSWMSDQDADIITNGIRELGRQDASNNKRPSTGDNVQVHKKQCVVASSSDSQKSKSNCASKSKDPQSVAAKNRRERISERLKVLQDLVPNGSKVDMVTMLEKAISYVQFLQLQVKVLATDEFWPAQGGKALGLSQVRGAIEVILASQRDRNSSSK